MIVCWAAKGGSGTTVVACALAVLSARRGPTTLVDLAGDVPAALGVPEPTSPGIAEWALSTTSGPELLAGLRVDVGGGLSLLPLGLARGGSSAADFGARLAVALTALGGEVVVDSGTGAPLPPLGAAASQSLLVTRACYLGLRRAIALDAGPTGVVLVREPGRSLRPVDVERAIGAPLVARIEIDPAVSRAVDAGLLTTRLPMGVFAELRPLGRQASAA